MKKGCYTLLIAITSLTACKKSGKTYQPPALFHKDITIHESIKGSEQIQNTLGLYQLPDQKQLLFVASRGAYESDARGFRIGSITKDSAVNWIRSYDLPETYSYQYATCATIDKNQFTWVGGHIFGVPDSYGRPFLVKLNSKGDFLVQEGNDATYAMLTATAKRECSGRSFTNAANARYARLCRNYGVALARGDHEAVRSVAGVSTPDNGSAAPAAGSAVAPSAPEDTGNAAADEAADEDASAKTKARDAINKGKQKLRGIFGGG